MLKPNPIRKSLLPAQSTPVHRARKTSASASTSTADGVTPSFIDFAGAPFAEEAVTPSFINGPFSLPFAADDAK